MQEQSVSADPIKSKASPIKNLRWYIGGLLFLSTVVNYIDRQTLNVLGPILKTEYHWTNTDFALVVIAFRIAYTLQSVTGRFIDWVGTRRGLSLTVSFYSIAAMMTSLATGFKSFAFFRFMLGLGESANWPGASKAVSEWFPKRESGWAVALFDSGSSIGGAIAGGIVRRAYRGFGSWRPAFIVTGVLGFAWLVLFRWLYRRPEEHPRLSPQEREYILTERADARPTDKDNPTERLSYQTLLNLPQTWGIIISKMLTDPVWFFVTDWLVIYLVSRGYRWEESVTGLLVPFLAADIGNFAGGGVSSWLIKRGWSVGAARKSVIVICALGMTLLIPVVFTNSYFWIVACIAISTLAYAALSTMVLNLPVDIYPTTSVASVSGMSGTGAGIGTIISVYLIGYISDRYSFEPILITGALIPLLAMIAVLTLVRNNEATDNGIVNRI